MGIIAFNCLYLLWFDARKITQDIDLQESKSLKDIPVVIMSSENVPSRINR